MNKQITDLAEKGIIVCAVVSGFKKWKFWEFSKIIIDKGKTAIEYEDGVRVKKESKILKDCWKKKTTKRKRGIRYGRKEFYEEKLDNTVEIERNMEDETWVFEERNERDEGFFE